MKVVEMFIIQTLLGSRVSGFECMVDCKKHKCTGDVKGVNTKIWNK